MSKQQLVKDSKINRTSRIAQNTALLFSRMFVLTIVNFVAIRLVLKGLGEEGYGLFNTVASVVTTTTFLCSILALSIQRFYSIALGNHNDKQFHEIYSASINLVLACSLLCLLIFETVGLWFVKTQLTIPIDKLGTVIWIYQFGLITFIFSLLQIPFTAAIFAKEDMGIYAIISTFDALGKLFVAFLIGFGDYNRLIFYSCGLLVVATLVLLGYVTNCKKNYKECCYTTHIDIMLYKKLMSFSGWTTFGSIANTGLTQGSIILINIYFGPIANAAFAIAQQINNALAALSNAMILPFRPAMMKAYAEKNTDYVNRLFMINNKLMLYALISISIPIIAEMGIILHLWLGQASKEMIVFSQLMVVYIVFMTMHTPITTIVHATGQIKKYHLIVESFMLLCFPLTWLFYELGYPSKTVFYCIILLTLCAHVMRLILLKKLFHEFSFKEYLVSLILPACGIVGVCSLFVVVIHAQMANYILRTVTTCFVTPLLGCMTAYLFGISQEEKMAFHAMVKNTLSKCRL